MNSNDTVIGDGGSCGIPKSGTRIATLFIALALSACATVPRDDLAYRLDNADLGITLAIGLNDSLAAGRVIDPETSDRIGAVLVAARSTVAVARELLARGERAEALRLLQEAESAQYGAQEILSETGEPLPDP